MTSPDPSLFAYRIRPSAVQAAVAAGLEGRSSEMVVQSLLVAQTGRPDALLTALLVANGSEWAVPTFSILTGLPPSIVKSALDRYLALQIEQDFLLTGAECIAFTLIRQGVRTVFAYPGTSELALCSAILQARDVKFVNARGDKEAGFMAAGACRVSPTSSISVLHGARGLTNGAGALADAQRNEIGMVSLVGLPSTRSARFLPPHGETDLLARLGPFVKWSYEPGVDLPRSAQVKNGSHQFARKLCDAFAEARTPPFGVSLFGVPQDLSEEAWISWSDIADVGRAAPRSGLDSKLLMLISELIHKSLKTVVILDDYYLRYDKSSDTLEEFAVASNCTTTQLRYRRGPMLFERLPNRVRGFIGWLNQDDEEHRKLLSEADLLITVEDRNMYPRVIGLLPETKKIVITSSATRTIKNGYISENDILVEGHPVETLSSIAKALQNRYPVQSVDGNASGSTDQSKIGIHDQRADASLVETVRLKLIHALCSWLSSLDSPIIVDDSQMFGGWISDYYDLLPDNVRILGDHGGFVGSGISYATGLAIHGQVGQVVCFLGDHGFTNGLQGLISAVQESARVVYIVCNNGESVSLIKQADEGGMSEVLGLLRRHLRNVEPLDYVHVAEGLGLTARSVAFSLTAREDEIRVATDALRSFLSEATAANGPTLIELRLPGYGPFWDGVWSVRGVDEIAQDSTDT
ncbi:MAG: thiamine pyrophosphate-binding protein [Chloroflexota bacterium]